MAGEAQVDPQIALRAAAGEAAKSLDADPSKKIDAAKAQKEAEKLRAAVDAKASESPAQTLAEKLSEGDRGTFEAADRAIEANIGTKVDVNGKKVLSTEEVGRGVDLVEANEIIKNVLDGKVITPAEWASPQYKGLRDSLDQLIDTSAFSYLPPDKRIELYAGLLADKTFVQAIRDRYAEVSATSLEDKVTEATRRRDVAKSKFDAKDAEKTGIDTNYEDVVNAKTEFETATGRGKELADLIAANLDVTLRKQNARLANLEAWLSDPTKAPAELSPGKPFSASEATSERDRLIDDIEAPGGLNEKISRRRELETLKREYPQRLKDLRTEKARVDSEFDIADSEYRDASAALSSATIKRVEAEQQFVHDMQNVIRDGITRRLDENLAEVQKVDLERLEKMKQDASTQQEKDMIDYIQKRYYKDRDVKWYSLDKSHKELMKGAAHEDVALLLKQGQGIDALVRRALATMPGISAGEKVEILRNPELVQKYGTKIATEAMGVYLRTGGKLSLQDGMYLESTGWGQGLVDKAIESNAAVKAVEEKLKAQGVLESGGFKQFLEKNKKGLAAGGMIALILAIMSGALPAGIVTGTATTLAGSFVSGVSNL